MRQHAAGRKCSGRALVGSNEWESLGGICWFGLVWVWLWFFVVLFCFSVNTARPLHARDPSGKCWCCYLSQVAWSELLRILEAVFQFLPFRFSCRHLDSQNSLAPNHPNLASCFSVGLTQSAFRPPSVHWMESSNLTLGLAGSHFNILATETEQTWGLTAVCASTPRACYQHVWSSSEWPSSKESISHFTALNVRKG